MDHVSAPSVLTDEQVAAYLARIGLPRPGRADRAALAELQRAHLEAVPFENLSVRLGEPIVLEPGALVAKITERHRGGFCYELNGAFAELLRALGFRVTLLAARVFGPERIGPPFDHMALRVDLDGEVWLADVGFGRFSELPLRLDERGEQADPAGVFTIVPHGDELDVRQNGAPQYRLDQRAYELTDFVPTCWWQATSPDSHFRRSVTCSRLAEGGRITLSGTRLIRTAADGSRTGQELDEAGALAAYRTHFGIELEQLP
ncbi:N-hydroxyarylamine O-acetyltransferase [Kitasatospora gansuensis]|uniref:N-hydroxyarylamine O-acetyltransferase n=1 Tax=Kitasatospora gansuensis TaxID=258050 RepID=A0A7W7S703_9ACTN|nr:arylamine N-acetyltransferase [Kitasatospora gansuensis]MBB4945094.1 N-hydroxyarylamine O-acetyltransferase [Kitasatospora gansuensis]